MDKRSDAELARAFRRLFAADDRVIAAYWWNFPRPIEIDFEKDATVRQHLRRLCAVAISNHDTVEIDVLSTQSAL